MAEIQVKLKGLSEIRQELRALQFDLANATDPEQMAQLSARAGELRDNLARANEQVSVFAAGSPFEQSSNALGLMGSQIRSLDFEGAAESAKLFATAAKGINGQVIATQLKGLGQTVVSLGGTFAKIGMALLTNPIFLMAAAIAGIVAIIGVLMNKLGFLQPILDAVGAVFEAMKWAIDKAVESIKAFLDWLGLTNFAAQDFASKQQKAFQGVIDKATELEEKIVTRYDREIELAKIAGEDTTKAELEKQKAIQITTKVRIESLRQQIEANKTSKALDEEELAEKKKQLNELKKALDNSRFEVKKIRKQEEVDNQKDREKEISDNKAAYAKMLADRKKYEQDRINIARQVRDLENDLLEEGIQKELRINADKYARLIEDTLRNEVLLDDEKKRLVDLLRQQEFERTKEIELSYSQQLADALKAADEQRKADAAAQAEQDKANKEAFNAILIEAQNKANEEDLANYQKYIEAKEGLQDSLVGSFKGLATSLEAAGIRTAALQKTLALVDIATSTAKSISQIVAGATAAATATGPAAPFVLAGYIASGIATVGSAIAAAYAALKSAPSIGGSVSGGGGAASAASGVQAAQPSVNLFGNSSSLNNINAPTSNEGSQEITVKAVVSETEITGTQNKIKKLTESAAL
jgi:hypothetical protein